MSKIIVLGATGNIGSATVKTLASQKADVTAGVRDPSKAKDLEASGAKIVKADMSQNQSELAHILSSYNTLYIVTPGSIDRATIATNAIKAAKEAKINYVLIVSLPTADNLNILFGRQYNAIEKELKSSGLKYGILRLPCFIDNIWGNAEPIKSHNSFYGPISGDIKFTTVAVQDAALAASVILRNPTEHIGKTYTITSDCKTGDQQAESYSLALGRKINYVNATFEGTRKSLVAFLPEWAVDGLLELFKLIEQNDVSQITYSNDFKMLTGKEPTTHLNWMWQNAKAF